jgi:hypothetical protein
MIEKKIEQLKIFKDIHLSNDERAILRASIARNIQISQSTPVVSIFHRGIQHGLRIGLSTFLFVVFVGGSVSVVADNSLPGDPLYSFKINVNEEVKGAFLKTPEEKLSWQSARIDNRLSEIKTLAASKTLTKAKQETAQRALDTHIKDFSKELGTLSDAEPSEALKVTATLEQSLKNQKEDIQKYIVDGSSEDQSDALKAVDATIEKVSAEENKIISKEIEQLTSDLNLVTETDITVEDTTETTPEVPPTTLPVTQ